MFGFMSMANDYEQRKVENTEINGATIDTAQVHDSARPYETAINHPDYKDGDWIVVELYDTKDLAKVGHKKWVEKFSSKDLPIQLVDVNETEVQDFAEMIGHSLRGAFVRKGFEGKEIAVNGNEKPHKQKALR
jgi:hypothetical protein